MQHGEKQTVSGSLCFSAPIPFCISGASAPTMMQKHSFAQENRAATPMDCPANSNYLSLSFKNAPIEITPKPTAPNVYAQKLFVLSAMPKSITPMPNNSTFIDFTCGALFPFAKRMIAYILLDRKEASSVQMAIPHAPFCFL